MSRLTAQAAARRGAQVTITNRTSERAATLARHIGGKTVDAPSDGTLGPFVGAVVAVSGKWAVHPQDAARLVESGTTVVDLSSPPAVSQTLQAQLGDRFVSIRSSWPMDYEAGWRRWSPSREASTAGGYDRETFCRRSRR
jgi:glutamyl-tRNA reductase